MVMDLKVKGMGDRLLLSTPFYLSPTCFLFVLPDIFYSDSTRPAKFQARSKKRYLQKGGVRGAASVLSSSLRCDGAMENGGSCGGDSVGDALRLALLLPCRRR